MFNNSGWDETIRGWILRYEDDNNIIIREIDMIVTL
jgi:hypothetical protein